MLIVTTPKVSQQSCSEVKLKLEQLFCPLSCQRVGDTALTSVAVSVLSQSSSAFGTLPLVNTGVCELSLIYVRGVTA